MKKSTLLLVLLLFLSFVVVSLPQIGIVKAESTIYVRADGTVEGTDKIQRDGDVYTLTGDLHGLHLRIERSNIIFDGNVHTLYQNIVLRYVTNVTVKNTFITQPEGTGIDLDHCSNSVIVNNTIWGCGLIDEWMGPYAAAISVSSGDSNIIIGNNITRNEIGIIINLAPDTLIYNNNFVSNHLDVSEWGGLGWMSVPSIAIFDNDKEGNYWSKYNGIDEDGNGIGDTPFRIDSYNTDNFPLMEPVPVIPEFPSWTPLLIMLVAVVAIIAVYRRGIPKNNLGREFS